MRRVSANKNVLSSRLNSVRQMSCCHSSTGRLFHSRGPATPKLLSTVFGDRTCVDINWSEVPTSYVRDELAVTNNSCIVSQTYCTVRLVTGIIILSVSHHVISYCRTMQNHLRVGTDKSRCSQYQVMMSGKDFLKSHVLSWRWKMYSDWKHVTVCDAVHCG